MEQEIVSADTSNGEGNDTEVVAQDTQVDAAALQTKLAELESTNRQLFERAKKAEGFVKVDGKWVKAPKPEEAIQTAQKLEAKTNELDETTLFSLELKGITEDEDIDVIRKVMQRAGLTVRQALKDDYVVEKLKANQAKREVQAATPSGTRRSGNTTDSFDAALAKAESTGELPKDFELRSKVVNALMEKTSGNRPSWRE